MHAEIRYSDQLGSYVIKDHASQNGTFINGARMCQVSACQVFEKISIM